MRLLRKKGTGDIFVWTEALSRREDMEDYLGRAIQGPLDEKQSYPSEPVKTHCVEFYSSANGIGDAICALYVACGVASAGFSVKFHAKHREWMKVEHPGVQILPERKCFDINDDYDGQLEAAYRGECKSRLRWYLRQLGRQFQIGNVTPARPERIYRPEPVIEGKYVVLAPITAGRSRTYPMAHWRRIAKLLLPSHNVVVLCGSDAKNLVEDGFFGMPVNIHVGLPIDTALRYYTNAACVVANDSGPAHIAGLYGVPCVAVVAQADPSFLFECSPTVVAVQPDASCTQCYWQEEGGWDRICEMGCSAIQTVKPEEVFREIERTVALPEAGRNEPHLHLDGELGEPVRHGRVHAGKESRAKARAKGGADARAEAAVQDR